MHETHDIGRFFWHAFYVVPSTPWYHRAETVEVDDPYRVCERTHILRIPFTYLAVAFGLWAKEPIDDEDAALLRALAGRETSPLDDEGHIVEDFEYRILDRD